MYGNQIILDNAGEHYSHRWYEPALTAALDEGAEFELIERRGDWLWIRLAGDQEGWIPDKTAAVY